MASVAHVLKSKTDRSFYTIDAGASVFDAIGLMSRMRIGALVVTRGVDVCGMVTERDYARKVILQDRSSRNTPVADIMSTAVRYVRSTQTSDDCMALMTEHRIRHLPVLTDGELAGIVSIGDVVKHRVEALEDERRHLTDYIQTGR